jgi:membrane fusion protein (multidrug efflux system)
MARFVTKAGAPSGPTPDLLIEARRVLKRHFLLVAAAVLIGLMVVAAVMRIAFAFAAESGRAPIQSLDRSDGMGELEASAVRWRRRPSAGMIPAPL